MVPVKVVSGSFGRLTKCGLFCLGRNNRMNRGPTLDRAERIYPHADNFSGLATWTRERGTYGEKNSACEDTYKPNIVFRYQFVYLSQSKLQSLSLCSVDATPPSLHTCSSLYEEGD